MPLDGPHSLPRFDGLRTVRLVPFCPVTIPCLGALAAIIMYDYFGANFPLADAVMYVSKIFGCYSTCVILYKIGTLTVLHRPKAAFLRALTTVATLIGNIVLGLLYLGIQASRIG